MRKNTLVLGASLKPYRYANLAMRSLLSKGIEVSAIGKEMARFKDIEIQTGFPILSDIHTVSIYLNPQNQQDYWSYIKKINPERVIFNPGSENPPFKAFLEDEGIFVEEACTLVLLSTDQY